MPQWRRGSSKWFTALLIGTALGVVTANVALTKLLGWALAAIAPELPRTPQDYRIVVFAAVSWAPPNGFPAKGRHQ